jgi:hypothetical protein
MSFQILTAVSIKMAAYWDMVPRSLVKAELHWSVLIVSIIRAMMSEAESISETSVYFYETTRYHNSEGCHLWLYFIFMLHNIVPYLKNTVKFEYKK